MFCNVRGLLAVAGMISMSISASAAVPKMVDFVASSLQFQKGLDDDVSGSMSQHFTLRIKNIGNTPSRYPGSIMRILLNGAVINGNVYGSNGSGGYNLNAPIAPGQEGLVLFSLPLNTIRGCAKVTVQIDADRTYQYGGDVFANDTKLMVAVDRNSIRACVPDVVHPLPGGVLKPVTSLMSPDQIDEVSDLDL